MIRVAAAAAAAAQGVPLGAEACADLAQARGPVPLCRIGVVADVQYADLDPGSNFAKTVTRMYRGSLEMLTKDAVPYWQAEGVDLVVQLGDVIDGACATSPKLDAGASGRALSNVMSQLAKGAGGEENVHHLVGNHELYNFDRTTLRVAFGMDGRTKNKEPPPGQMFYAFSPCRGYRIVVLDAFHEALIGRPSASQEYQNALATLRRNNPNDVLKPGVNWTAGYVPPAVCTPVIVAHGLHPIAWRLTACKTSLPLGSPVLTGASVSWRSLGNCTTPPRLRPALICPTLLHLPHSARFASFQPVPKYLTTEVWVKPSSAGCRLSWNQQKHAATEWWSFHTPSFTPRRARALPWCSIMIKHSRF